MGILVSHVTVDCTAPHDLARWWSAALGWSVDVYDDDEVYLTPSEPNQPELLFLRTPDRKTVKNRLHLDLRPQDGSDQEIELARLLALGATPVDIGQDEVTWHVLADPEGNEFCLLRSTPAEVAAQEQLAANPT